MAIIFYRKLGFTPFDTSNQRTLTIGGSITVWLTSCLTGLDLTKQVNKLLNLHKKSS